MIGRNQDGDNAANIETKQSRMKIQSKILYIYELIPQIAVIEIHEQLKTTLMMFCSEAFF